MCGRFTLRTPTPILIEHFGLGRIPDLPARFNIAPTQSVAAVRQTGAERELVMLRWGLIPSWSNDPAIGGRMINARSETVAEKPSFRTAFRQRRCLVMADGFYEWKTTGKTKQPLHITLADGDPFALAGLWESWQPDKSEPAIETCTILTTEANALMREIHDRMPVILPPETYATWLDPQVKTTEEVKPLLAQYPAEAMSARPVSTHVNNARHEDARCLDEL